MYHGTSIVHVRRLQALGRFLTCLGCLSLVALASACGSNSTGAVGAAGAGSSSGSTSTSGASSSGGSSGAGASSGGGSSSGSASSSGASGSSSGGNADGGSGADASSSGGNADGAAGTDGGAVLSAGCGKTPVLWNPATGTPVRSEWPPAGSYNQIMTQSAGMNRTYYVQVPSNYDKTHPYRLILSYHWATGAGIEIVDCHSEGIDCYTTQSPFFGLWELANSTTIFVAADGTPAPTVESAATANNNGSPKVTNSGAGWYNTNGMDETFTDDILQQVENDLCIDKSHVELEGFSFGGAMSFTLACARPGVFSAAVTHSAGGLPVPTTCQPIPYFASLGVEEGGGQTSTADFFAMTNGCTIQTWAAPAAGTHMCYDYMNCAAGDPVRWCPYGKQSATADHTPSPRDDGQSTTWMPAEVWKFMTQF